jgi:HEAT repeat protein
MPAARSAARNLALVAGAVVVVGAIAVWWISRLRAVEQEAEPSGDDALALSDLRSQLRVLQSALKRIERGKSADAEPPVPVPAREEPSRGGPEEASVAHLRALVSAHERAPEGRDRDRILDRFTYAHSLFAEMTGDLQFLPFLRGVIATSPSPDQRRYAVIALHGVGRPEVVDLLEELIQDPHAEVRFYAAEALPWVTGAQRDRARRLLAAQLEHDDAEVRRIVALSLGVVVGDPAHAEAMLLRLSAETQDEVLEALVFGVRRLLGPGAEARIRALLETLERSRADRIAALLR